jgi:hypothetical protein
MAKKTSTPIDQDFQKFWDAYGLKRDRVAAERAWRKLSKSDRRAALASIQRYRDDCESRGIQRMYAQGYLNHRRWEDEGEALVSSSSTSEAAKPSAKFFDERSGKAERQVSSNSAQPTPETCSLKPETRDSDLPDMAIW